MKRAKELLSFLIAVAMCAGFMPGYTLTAFALDANTAWYNSSSTEFTLTNAAQLAGLASLVNAGTDFDGKTIKLGNSINLNNEEWTPIGTTSNPFKGTFNGQGYTAQNLSVSGYTCAGLFGYADGSAVIKNVKVTGSVSGTYYVGGIVGFTTSEVTVENCTNSATVSSSGNYAGGVVGFNRFGTVTGCTNSGTVSNSQSGNGNSSYAGGVAGRNAGGTVTGCTNSGEVINNGLSPSSYNYVGGITSTNDNNGTVSDCFNSGAINGNGGCAGGVVGWNYSSLITDCYNTGTVSGGTTVAYTGGVTGWNVGEISNCYNTGAVSTGNSVGGVVGYNTGTLSNNYYLSDTADTATGQTAKTKTQFASGEVAYLLNSDTIDGTQAWYQNIDSGTADSFPVLDSTHGTVYCTALCDNSYASYSNSSANGFVIHVGGYDSDGFCTVCGGYQPATLNGSTYEISNAGQLFWFASLVNGDTTQEDITAANTSASAVLTTNITIPSGREWTPIATKSAPYKGTFDGGSYTVSGLSVTTAADTTDAVYVGLFGYINAGTVKDLTVSGKIDVSGSTIYAGGIVGTVHNSVLSNLTSNVSLTAAATVKGTFGGVAASVEGTGDGSAHSTMERCANYGTVTASGVLDCVGGLTGFMNSATIENCANYGEVDTSGGTAAVSAGIYTGGIVSYINNANAVVENCLNIGKVSGAVDTSIVSYTGAIVGRINTNVKEVSNCYYLSTSAGAGVGGNGSSVTAETEAKDADALASGEVTWLLTGGTTDGTQAWYQTLGADNYPVLDSSHCTVYYNTAACDGSSVADSTYSNSCVIHAGYDADGFCTNCGGYEPAEKNGEGAYEIGNAGQLFWFAALVKGDVTQEDITAAITNASAVLTKSIDLDGREWAPIGTKSAPYTGTFDGNGKTISGLSITTASDYMGLFGYVSAGTIKDLTVSGAINVSGSSLYAGGIVGTVKNGVLSNLTSNVSVTANDGKKGTFGGVAATAEGDDGTAGSTVENCTYNGTVKASGVLDCVGGIVGYMNAAAIVNCANYGVVDTSGGTAAASAGIYTGGIVSYINNENAVVTNCLNIGKVSGAADTSIVSYTGAIVGRIRAQLGEITNTYYLNTSADAAYGADESGAELGMTAKTEAELASGETAYLLQNGESNSVWGQDLANDVYPMLHETNVVKVTFINGNSNIVRYANVGAVCANYPTGTYSFYLDSALTERIDTSVYTFSGDTVVYVTAAALEIRGVTVSGNTVSVEITNTIADKGVVIVAAYDADGAMIDMATADLPTVSGTVSVEIDTAKAATVSAFIWESLETMVPLCGAVVSE